MKSSSLSYFRPSVLYSIIPALIFFFASGCDTGGGGGVFATPENADQGRFLDSAVEGLQYDSPAWSGITEADGTFFYQAGEAVTFSIGNVILGTSTAKEIITPLDLIPGTENTTNPAVINISLLLQSLDLDGNPDNGITITGDMRELLKEFSIDFSDPDFAQNPEVQRMFDRLNENMIYGEEERGLTSAEDAQIHLEETLTVIEEEAIAAEEALENIEFNASIISPSGHGILVQGQGFVMEGSVGGSESYTCLWNFGDGERSSPFEDPGFIYFNTPGTYMVTFFVTDTITGATKSDFRYITVWDPAEVDQSIYGYPPGKDVPAIIKISKPQDMSVTVGESLHLPAIVTRGNPPFRYLWGYDSTVVYTWEEDPLDATFTFTEAGIHTITIWLKDSTGSGDQWNDGVMITVSN